MMSNNFEQQALEKNNKREIFNIIIIFSLLFFL